MATFDDFDSAHRFREIIADVAATVVDKMRPRDRMASVVSYSPTNGTASVIYVGDSTAVTLPTLGSGPFNVGQTVRVTGPLGARYIDTPIGNQFPVHRGKNLFDNGMNKICQGYNILSPATVAVPASTTVFMPADRWALENASGVGLVGYDYPVGSGTVYTSSNQAMLIQNQTAGVGAAVTPTASQYVRLRQSIEGFRVADLQWGTAAAKPVTFAFDLASQVTGNAILEVELTGTVPWKISRQIAMTAGEFVSPVTIPGLTSSAGTWSNISTSAALSVSLWLVAGTTFNSGSVANLNTNWTSATTPNTRAAGCGNPWPTSTITQVNIYSEQMEEGNIFTGFEDIPFDQEMRTCNRYYQFLQNLKMYGISLSAANSGVARMGANLRVPLRAAPALTIVGGPINTYDGANIGTIANTAAIGSNYSTFELIEFDAAHTMAAGTGPNRAIETYISGSWAIVADARI